MNSIGTTRSPWSHSICDSCWLRRAEARSSTGLTLTLAEINKNPHRLPAIERSIELCCYCSALHNSGIYQRDDPRSLKCMGIHDSSITKAVNCISEQKAYSLLRNMLEDPIKRKCLAQDEVDAIHYLITLHESHKGENRS